MKYFWLAFLIMSGPALAMDRPEECRMITRHVPDADVTYQPGVDVEGKPVAPADLGASPFGVPDVMVVPLSVDLARRLNDPVDGLTAEAPLGFLEIYPDGRMLYNGQDVTEQAVALCRQDWSAAEPLPEAPAGQESSAQAVEYGQEQGNPLESQPVPEAAAPSAQPGELIEGGEGRNEGIE